MVALFILALLLASRAPPATATATATTVGQQQCEPGVLAKHVTAVCAPGKATAPCCDEVIAIGDLSCFCRVAAESRFLIAGLSETTLLELYTTCRGGNLAAAHFDTACAGALPRKSKDGAVIHIGGGASKQGACDSQRLSMDLVTTCEMELESPSSTCCDSMFKVIGHGSSCICNVTWEASFKMSTLQRNASLLKLHQSCGGDPGMASYLHIQDACAQPTVEEPEKDCPPVVLPIVSKLMWFGFGWAFALFIMAMLIALVWFLRRRQGSRIYTAERLAGSEIGVEEMEDGDEGVLLGPIGRRPHALPPPYSSSDDFVPRLSPARILESIHIAPQ